MSTTPVPSSPAANLSTLSLNFPLATVGSTAPALSLTLSNGGGQALLLNGPVLSDTTNFAVTTTCGLSLAAGGTCTLAVQFRASAPGSFAATLKLTDNSGGVAGAQQIVALSAVATPVPLAQAVLSPATLSFPAQVIQASGTSLPATLTNAGTAPLLLGGSALSDPADFQLTSTCGASLAPGTSCILSVQFAPANPGAHPATLTITDNSGGVSGAQQVLVLSGTGLPVPEPVALVSTAMLPFPGTAVGSRSAAQIISVANTGDAPLMLGMPILSDGSDYGLTTTCGASLAAGASCTVVVLLLRRASAPCQRP